MTFHSLFYFRASISAPPICPCYFHYYSNCQEFLFLIAKYYSFILYQANKLGENLINSIWRRG